MTSQHDDLGIRCYFLDLSQGDMAVHALTALGRRPLQSDHPYQILGPIGDPDDVGF